MSRSKGRESVDTSFKNLVMKGKQGIRCWLEDDITFEAEVYLCFFFPNFNSHKPVNQGLCIKDVTLS